MFTLLSSLEGASNAEIKLALGAFDCFMNELTPKHRKNVEYFLLTDFKIETNVWKEQISLMDSNEFSASILQKADLLLCPFSTTTQPELKKLLNLGIPVLALNSSVTHSNLPNSSMVLVEETRVEQQISSYAHLMKVLYFDPEARKVLAKSAKMVAKRLRKKPVKKFSTTTS